MSTYAAWSSIIRKAFVSNQRIRTGRPKVIVKTTTGSPDGAVSGIVGLLCWNSFDSDAYICTATPNTWVKINA